MERFAHIMANGMPFWKRGEWLDTRSSMRGDLGVRARTAGEQLSSRSRVGDPLRELRDIRVPPEGVKALGLPDVPPDAPPIAPVEEKLGWFEVTVVDAWGEPVGGLDLEVSYEGTRKKVRTPANGNVRVEGVSASFGSVKFSDVPAARDVVRPRWTKKQPDSRPEVDNPQVVALAPDMGAVSLTSETPVTIVLVRPLPRVRLIGMHFDTNKSFLRETAMAGIRKVVEIYARISAGHLLVVGHTDTAADDAYNLDLSVERAEAVVAYLRNDAASWEVWFDDAKPKQKRWGAIEIAHMISVFPCEQTVAGFQSFSNESRGTTLVVDGVAGKATRRALIEAYMSLDGTTLPSSIGTTIHGCGEFFPVKATGDDVHDEENRRVEIFCFDGEIGPPVPGKKAKKNEPEYAGWEQQVTKTIDFEDADATPPFDLMLTADPLSKPRLLILDKDGKLVRALGEADGERHGSSILFLVDPKSLPSPTQFVAEVWGAGFPHGVRFDPQALGKALKGGDSIGAAAIVYGDPTPASSAPASSAALKESAAPTVTVNVLQVRLVASDGVSPSNLEIEIARTSGAGATDVHTNELLDSMTISLDGTPSAARKGSVFGEFKLAAGKTDFKLVIEIPDPDPTARPLHIEHTLKFNSVGATTMLDTTGLHPRLTGVAAGSTVAPGAMQWTLQLDVSFLGVTKRTARLNPAYGAPKSSNAATIHGTINDDPLQKGTTRIREDPRRRDASPNTYLLTSPTDKIARTETVNVFLYFQNESGAHPDAASHDFHNTTRTLVAPAARSPGSKQGDYGTPLHAGKGYQSYPACGWAGQLEASGADVVFIMPNTIFTGETSASFGDLDSADTGIPRIERLLFMLWADRQDRTGDPPKLGKLLVGGWSSGMNAVFQWFQTDAFHRVDAFICFDATGAVFPGGKPTFPPKGKPQPFPLGSMWEQWLNQKPAPRLGTTQRVGDRFVAFLSGSYSQAEAIAAATHLRKVGLGARLLIEEPSALSFWYDDADYIGAHRGSALPKTVVPDQICVVAEKGTKQINSYVLELCHGSNPKITLNVRNVSIHEAADFLTNSLGIGFDKKGSMKIIEAKDFDEGVGRPIVKDPVTLLKSKPAPPYTDVVSLQNTTSLEEFDRAGKERHTWSVSGGKTTSSGFKGYLQLCLEAAKAKSIV